MNLHVFQNKYCIFVQIFSVYIMQSENQKPKKNRKQKLNLVELPKEKIGVLLALNIYDIKEKIQNVLSEVDNISIDEEDSKKTLEKLKKSIPNSLSNTLKELKKSLKIPIELPPPGKALSENRV